MATQSVKIPVELQLNNIQGQINNLRKALSGVKEGTSAYKSLNTVLQQLERQFTAVQIESKKAFTSHSQINHFANNIEKLGNLAAVFQERMSEVDLKDFDIDLTAFNAAEKKVKDLTAELELLKSGKLGQDVFEDFGLEELSKKLKIDVTKDSLFSEVILELDNAYKAIDENINKMYKQAERAKDARQQFAKGLGKSIGKGEFSKDIEALAKANSTTSITAASRDSVTTDLLASLGLNLKGVKSSGNTAAEYISSVTQSISAKIKEYNAKVQKEINSLTKTKSDLEDALDLVSDLKNSGQKNLSQEDKDNIFNLTGINITQKSIESAQTHLNDLIRKSLAATQKQESSLIKIDNATIQQAATNAAKQLQIDSKIQAKAFVLEVTKLLQAGGMQQNAKDLEMLPGEELPDYISRLTEMVRQRGIELREEYSNIITDIKTQEDLLDQTSDTQFKLGEENLDRTTLQIPQVEEDLNKAKEGLEQAGQAAKDSITSVKQVGDACEETGKEVRSMGDQAVTGGEQLKQLSESARRLENVQNAIKRWFGFYEVINLTKRAISEAINHIRELDKVMTEIAVVTDMTQNELWDQISTYSAMAQKYGATTQGVYEVSQLYYQQGLQTAEVMQLTEETLKMAKIAGLDYADATDYMTVAIRGFKLEMSDAQNIVDVYSNIAAVTASDTEELAVAMSKTASSAEAVGSSFENTTAMIALMVETTREAPENIGSAMKSIISRYGEMTTNPAAIMDSEGEAMSLNKVDKALQSVGITLQDVNGQFRNFDEVILELSSKWDTIDKNTQRYIATVMAGNRQQSRFLALVGNYDRLSELYEEAANSQDAATLQTLKTMDSIETKINQLKTTFQEFYTNTGVEDLIKGIIDFTTQVIERIDGIPKVFDKIPLAALAMIGTLITTGKSGATLLMRGIFQIFDSMLPEVKVEGVKIGKYLKEGIEAGSKGVGNNIIKEVNISAKKAKIGTSLAAAGSIISSLSLSLIPLETQAGRITSGLIQGVGGFASAIGQVATGNYLGAIITAVSTLTSVIATMHETAEEKIERLTKAAEEANNDYLLKKNDFKNLDTEIKKLKELEKARYDSDEAYQNWIDYQNEIANKYPELIDYIDGEGNAILELSNSYAVLADARLQATEAAIKANKANIDLTQNEQKQTESNKNNIDTLLKNTTLFSSQIFGYSSNETYDKIFSIQGGQASLGILNQESETYSYSNPEDITKLGSELINTIFSNAIDGLTIEEISNWENLRSANEQISGFEDLILNNILPGLALNLSQVLGEEFDLKEFELQTDEYDISRLFNYISGIYQKVDQENKLAQKQVKIAQQSYLSSMIQWSNTEQEMLENTSFTEMLEEIPSINAIIEDTLKNRAKDFESLDVYAESAQYDTDYTEIINYLTDWYSSLSSSAKEQFITAYGNMGSYSFEDFKQIIHFNDLNKETQDIIEKQFNEQYRQSQENFYNALNTQKNNLGISQKLGYYNFNDKIGSEYFDDILDMYYTYFDMFEEGNKNLAVSGMQNLSELWNAIGDLEGSLQIQVSDYLTSDEVDLTSISGLYEAVAHLRELEVDESIITLLTNLSSSLVPNLNTEWQASLNNITSNLENLTDAFEKASSGMNLTDAQALASKLGTTLTDSDFVFNQGQYYYNNVEAIKEAYLKNNEETKKALEENTKEQIDILTKVDTDFTLEEQETYSTLQNTYKEVFENLTEEERQGAKTWQQYAIAQIKESQIDFYEAEENYLKYLGNSTALAIGDLASFLNNFKDSEGNSTIDENALKEAIATGDTSKLTGETLKVYYDYEEDLTKLITSSTDDILNSILESFSSQRVQTVDITNLSDYNNKLYEALKSSGLEFEEIGEKEIVKINPSDITESEYSNILKATNYTVEQYNEAMVSFIKSSSKNYQSIFEDITSNPREVDLSTVEELANVLGMQIDDVIQLYFQENVDGTYSVLNNKLGMMASHLEGIAPAITNLENTEELIADGLIAYTDEILGYISSGISGDLSNVDFSKLGEYIASLTDGQVSLSFERTAEGIKLTQSSLLQIYSTLQANNSLAAQIVLDELTESAMDADENLNNIYKVMERIAEINEELSTAGISDEREDALRAELALAENIRDTLMEAGDAFNFMDQDLPTGMTNPLSAWEGMSDAFEVLDGEDFAAGYMDFTDLYNMINQMAAAGVTLQTEAGAFELNSENAAAMIEAAAGALTNVDGETFVDLSQLGAQFQFGAEGMKEGLTEGIHTLAENQIEMLDAAIGVLETVVAMEGIGDVIGEDNEFTLSDLLLFGSDGSTIFTPEYKNWRKNLQTTLEENSEVKAIFDSIFVDGLRLSTWIGMSADELAGKSEEAQTQFLQALEALYSLSERGDFDPNNLQSIFDIFTQVGFNGYVELKDKDGNITGYWYNGKEYSSPAEANAAISATLAGGVLEKDFTAQTNEAGEITGYTTTVTFGENTIELFVDPENNTTYTTPNGFSGSTPDEALKAEYDDFLSKMPEAKQGQWTFEGWKTKLGWKTEVVPELTIDQQAVLGATAEERTKIQQILESGAVSSDEDHNLLMKFGVDLAPGTELTTEQIAELKTAFGIEDKTVNLTVNTEGISEGIIGILDGTKTEIPVNVNLTLNQQTTEEAETGLSTDAISNLTINLSDNLTIENLELIKQFNEAILAAKTNSEVTSGLTITITGLDETQISNIEAYNSAVEGVPTEEVTSKISGEVSIPATTMLEIIKLKAAVEALKASPEINSTIKAEAEGNALAVITDILAVYGYNNETANLIFNAIDNNTIDTILTDLENITGKEIDITANLNDTQIQKDLADLTAPETKTITIVYEEPTLVGPGPDTSIPSYYVSGIDNNSGNIAPIGQYSKLDASAVEDITAHVDNGTFQNGTFTITEIKADGTELTTTATLAELQAGVVNFGGEISTPTVSSSRGELNRGQGTSSNTAATSTAPLLDMSAITTQLQSVGEAGLTAAENISSAATKLTSIDTAPISVASARINNLAKAADSIKATAASRIWNLVSALKAIPSSKTVEIKYKINVTVESSGDGTATGRILGGSGITSFGKNTASGSLAKGNISGQALASGHKKTLMGELGPELVVSNGRYFIVGQNGAEFVDLADDAIVFNHLQTKKLIKNGHAGTGKPVTNEANAVALASGNVNGPAMASASDALAELKQIRAMWQALLDSSASDLGKKAGSGGGGGGGGGGGSTEDVKAVTGELERWYNLLRQIDSLEQHITLEQAKRANLMNGYKYVDSLEAELNMLKEQQQAYKKLAELQKDYYDRRREDLLSTDYSKIFTYTEHGLMQYVDGENRGLDILAKLNERDATGKLINNAVNAKTQLKYLKNVGFDTSILKYNDDGTKAENEEQMMENFWANVDGWMEELDGLYDSYHEATTNFEESTEKINEILQEYIDNQLAVEEKLMQAIQDREQAEIDRIQDEKDALEEAAQDYIDGLNEALSKERDMYQKNETDAETAKLQRQLAILQRSGGSTSEIKSLQDQIDSRLQDAYFQEQQNQIDAIQEASDNQIEKLQTQIDLMTETLEYQKENGLLWQEVYEMMNNWTPEQLLQFVEQYTKSYKEDSALENEEKSKETLKENEIWVANRTNKEREQAWNDYYNSANYDKELKEANKDKAFSAYQTAYESGGKEAAETAANKVFENVKNSNVQQEDSASKTEEEKKEPAKVEPPISITGKLKGGNVHMRAKADANSKVIKKIPKGTTVTLTGMSKKKNDGYYWFKASAAGKSGYMAYTSRWGDFSGNINELPKFEKGGLVDFTGPAWVDGSKSKPEAFLSAEDTAMLKSRIFSNSDGSLKALVAALEAITSDTSKYSAQTNTESIVIQNAQVNIQPGTISNDYDARRAGEMALEEMVKIARKTTNRVVSR